MSQNTPQRIGARVRQHRLCASLNTHQAALLAGITRADWLEIEDGKCIMIGSLIRYIATSLGVPVSALIVSEDS